MSITSSMLLLLGTVLHLESMKYGELSGLLMITESYAVIPAAVLSICKDFYTSKLKCSEAFQGK